MECFNFIGHLRVRDFLQDSNFPVDVIDDYNAYLHTSLVYKPINNCTIQLTGHYILGLFDNNLNKRNYFADTSGASYINQSKTVSLLLKYKFY